MKPKIVPWNQGQWDTPPCSVQELNGQLLVVAAPGSDYWEKTLYGFQHASGHALLSKWPARDGVEVSFSLCGLSELYDQAG